MSNTPSLGTCTPSFPATQPTSFLPREIEHCADPQEVSLRHLAEPTTFTPMNSVMEKWEAQVLKFVSKLVRHENSRERDTEGAIHWNSKSPKLQSGLQRDGGINFTDKDWIRFIWKGCNKT